MPSSQEPFFAQALSARAQIVSAMDEIHALLAECDDDEVPTWTAQIKELRKALAILDEQIELRRQSPLSDDTVR